MWTYNHTNELYHWGIKGMKWGVRRYQNSDGSLTPAGKKRYNSIVESKPKGEQPSGWKYQLPDRLKRQSDRDGINPRGTYGTLPDLDRYTIGVRKYANPTTAAGKKRHVEDHSDHSKTYRKDVRTMSDQELRDSLNRLNMERQYAQLTAKEKSTGRKWVESLLTESAKEIAKSYITKYAKKGLELGVKAAADKISSKK